MTPEAWRRRLEAAIGVPATEGNTVEVLRNGIRIFPALLDAIEAAEHTIDFATYVYWQGDIAQRFARALSARARDGVRVRVLLDAVGSLRMDADLIDHMRDAGCAVEMFRHVGDGVEDLNHRGHRKILVCDATVGFTGGVGIAEEWEGDARDASEWRDDHFRVLGPAVDGLAAAFLANWMETQGRCPPFDDDPPEHRRDGTSVVQVAQGPTQAGWGELAVQYAAVITGATRQLNLTNAYFIPDEAFEELLLDAVRRGVTVRILVPGPHQDRPVVTLANREILERLLDGGVEIFDFQPTMLHAKVMTVDGEVAVVGSANFDPRSLHLNEETNLAVIDTAVVERLDDDFEADLARAVPIDLADLEERGALARAAEHAVGLLQAWL